MVWGGLLVWFWGSGRIVSYLHPHFHAYVGIAGFALLALVPLWWLASRSGTSNDCGSCGCHDHDHVKRSRSIWFGQSILYLILLVPVAGAAFVSPSQFGEAAVMNRGIITDLSGLPNVLSSRASSWEDAPLIGGEDLPDVENWPEGQEEGVEYFTRGEDGAIQLETMDLLFAATEPSMQEEFAGERIAIIGQYIPPRGEDSTGFDLVRMFVVCCAADARPLGIKVVAPETIKIPRMGWVRITGVARFPLVDGRTEPLLEMEKIEEIEPPRETFLF
jgi:uncharacterized repeat protein (TIGR03943 family)